MDIQQANFKSFGSRQNIQLFKNKVAFQYKNPWYEYHDEFEYADLRPKAVREKMGDEMWTDAGAYLFLGFILWGLLNFFLIFFHIIFIPDSSHFLDRGLGALCFQLITGIGLLVVIMSIATIFLRLVRYEFITFITKTDMIAFRIKYSKRNKVVAEQIVKSILDKIKNSSA
jgi:hypothetical protein